MLGRSGLRVSELSLGTMTFGEAWGWGPSHDEDESIFKAYVAAGGNFLDTADVYTNGSSEKIPGELLRSMRSKALLATKVSFNTSPGVPTLAAIIARAWCWRWRAA